MSFLSLITSARPPLSRRRRAAGLTIIELMVVVAIISILLGLVLTGIVNAKRSARQLQCANNLKGWGHVILNYANSLTDLSTGTGKGAGIMPPYYMADATSPLFGKSFEDLLLPFLTVNTSKLGCPQAAKGMRWSLKMNRNSLNTTSSPDRGKNLTNVKSPMTLVFMFDGDETNGNPANPSAGDADHKYSDADARQDACVFRHPGDKANILYAEGHVVGRTREELLNLNAAVVLAYSPTRTDEWTFGFDDFNPPPPAGGGGGGLPTYTPPADADPTAGTATANPNPVSEGATCTFTIAASDAEGPVTINWTFNDPNANAGNPNIITGPNVYHKFNAANTYAVTARVYDSFGHVLARPVDVVVKNFPPNVASVAPTAPPVSIGLSETLLAQATDPEGDTITYVWDWGDGAGLQTTSGGAGDDTPHTYAGGGTYSMQVSVKDLTGQGNTASYTVIAKNWPPQIASVAPNAPPVSIGAAETFSTSPAFSGAVGGTDPEGDSVTYVWSWGDGTSSTLTDGAGDAVAHTYAAAGNITVTVAVKDATSSGNTVTYVANAANSNPIVTSVAPNAPPIGVAIAETFTTNPLYSAADPDGNPVTYDWDWGDGSSTLDLVGAAGDDEPHTYATMGTYTLKVTAKDAYGPAPFNFATLQVVVANQKPVVTSIAPNAPPVSPALAETFTTTPLYSTADPEDHVVTYDWEWGDGSSTLGLVGAVGDDEPHTYAAVGTYTLKVTVKDAYGPAPFNFGTLQVVVANTIPTITSISADAAPVSVGIGETFTTNPLFSAADAEGNVVTYDWEWGDGASTVGLVGTAGDNEGHTYATMGTYTLKVTVKDAGGPAPFNFATLPVVVGNQKPTVTDITYTAPVNKTVAKTFTSAPAYTAADPEDHRDLTYDWDWGDGTSSTGLINGAGDDEPHTYANTGTFQIKVTIKDPYGPAPWNVYTESVVVAP